MLHQRVLQQFACQSARHGERLQLRALARTNFSSVTKNGAHDTGRRKAETPLVQNSGSRLMHWISRGSTMQMYCSLILAGSMVYQADAGAELHATLLNAGVLASASVTAFFGANLACGRVITDVASVRQVGQTGELVKFSVLGAAGKKHHFEVPPSAIRIVDHPIGDKYTIQMVGSKTRLSLDLSTGECLNRRALGMVLSGKPLVERRSVQNQSKGKRNKKKHKNK